MKRKHITEEDYAIAFENGLTKVQVDARVRALGWEIERAITEPINEVGQTSFTAEEMKIMKEHGVPETVAYSRIHSYVPKWERERAITTPVRTRNR